MTRKGLLTKCCVTFWLNFFMHGWAQNAQVADHFGKIVLYQLKPMQVATTFVPFFIEKHYVVAM